MPMQTTDAAGSVVRQAVQGHYSFGTRPALTTTPSSFWSNPERYPTAVVGVETPSKFFLPAAAEGFPAFELDAEPGAYVLTGVEAGVVAERMVSADSGAYVLTGFAASTIADRIVSADPGVYVITGFEAGIVSGRVISADPGVYTLTGFSADLTFTGGAAFFLNAEPGAYAISGMDAGLPADRVLSADPGAYVLAGFSAGTLATRVLVASPGAYVLTGVATGLVFSGDPVVVVVPKKWTTHRFGVY